METKEEKNEEKTTGVRVSDEVVGWTEAETQESAYFLKPSFDTTTFWGEDFVFMKERKEESRWQPLFSVGKGRIIIDAE